VQKSYISFRAKYSTYDYLFILKQKVNKSIYFKKRIFITLISFDKEKGILEPLVVKLDFFFVYI